jgi:murein DD-endopeptidase MepM/ murein hydrolase activator NlpD
MGRHEKIAISLKPPAPTARTVLEHRKKLETERDGLHTGAAALALASAQGDADAQDALAAIPAKFAAIQFEIDLNHEAYKLAHKQDADAEVAWRESLQSTDPEDLIAGINKDECCHRCQPNSPGGCVITAGYPYAGSQCGHPIREKHMVFGRDETGVRQFLYRQNAQALKVFTAARKRLGVA